MNQKEIQDSIRENNESEVKRNSVYEETFKEIISRAARDSDN